MGLTKPRASQIYDIDYKQSVRVITLTNITLSGGAPSQVDSVNLSLNDRVLVAGQSNTAQNGLYYVTTLGSGSNGTWQRSTDGNQTGEIESGMIVMVTEGTIWADTSWKLVTNDPITIGVSGLVFEQNTGNAFGNINANGTAVTANTASSILNLTAGTNISITGNNTTKTVTIGVTGISLNSISNGTSNVNVVSSGGNVTVGVGGTSNVAVFSSTGANITGTLGVTGNITGGNLSGTSITGTLTTAAQTNITSVGTLGSLTVTANVAGGNLTTAGQVVATGNVSGGNINVTGNIVDTGALSLITGASGNINMAPNGSTVLVATTTGANILGTLNATGNANVGNIGATNVVATNLTGTLQTAAQTNITSVGTLGSLNVTGNVTGGNINSNALVSGTTISATGNLVGGNANITNAVNAATISTSGNATVGGNLIVQGNITYINIEDLQIEDPVIILGTGPNGAPLTVNDNKDRGIFLEYYTTGIGNAFMGWDNSTGNMIVAANAALTNDVVSVISYGTLQTGNLYVQSVQSTGNVSGGNVTTAGLISATGNISGGNLSGTSITGTLLTAAQTNITSVGTLGSLTVTANVAGGNLTTAGQVAASGNITGGNIIANGRPLTSLNATNIDTGTLAQARLANSTLILGNTTLTLGGTTTTVAGLSSVTSTTFVGALTGAATTAGTVTTAAQPNITSVGTLSSLTVTANVAGGNLTTAGQISATGTITSTGATNGTGFAVGNSAVSNVGLGFFPTAGTRGDYAIRDYSNVTSTMYFDVGMGGSPAGEFQFRTSNAYTLLMRANSTGVYSSGVVSATGIVSGLELTSTQSSGDEGGQLNLAKPATNNSLGGNIIVDVYQNRFRIFENGGTNRGAYIDLTTCNASVGTNLLSGGGGGGTPGGSNTQVQFNDGGVFGGAAGFTFDKTTNTLTANIIASTNNGSGTNFKVGDDAWVGDINTADTLSIRGQQNAANAYIIFGNANANALGRAGTGPLTYTGAFTATGNISGGNLSGTSIAGTLTTATQTNITSVGTLSSLTVTANVAGGNITTAGQVAATGNITGGNIIANGRPLTSLNASNIDTGTLSQARLANSTLTLGNTTLTLGATTTTVAGLSSVTSTTFVGALTGAATTAGTVTTAAQPNITSVGTLSSLTVTANVAGGNLTTAGQVVATGNVSGGNLTTIGQVTAVGNISGNFFIGNGRFLTGISASGGGISFTSQANTPPATPNNGDFWFDTVTDIKYQYINDGTSSQWIDQSFPTSFGAITANSVTATTLTGILSSPKTLSSNVTLAADTNSVLISPVTINSGVIITIPDSSTLQVIP
jgi:hypothetical protein